MKYLSKFDAEGKRISSYPLDVLMTAETIKSMKSDGYIEIDEGEWNYYIGNYGMGKNGTGYVRDAKTGKPVDAPAYVPTVGEKMSEIKANYESQIDALKESLATATLAGGDDLVADLKAEYAELMAEYQNALKGVE